MNWPQNANSNYNSRFPTKNIFISNGLQTLEQEPQYFDPRANLVQVKAQHGNINRQSINSYEFQEMRSQNSNAKSSQDLSSLVKRAEKET